MVEVVALAVAAALGYNSCTHRSRSNLTGHSTICRRDRTISHMYGAVGPCESSEREIKRMRINEANENLLVLSWRKVFAVIICIFRTARCRRRPLRFPPHQQSLAASPRRPSLPSRHGVPHPPHLRPRLHPAHRPSCPPLLSRHKAGGVLHRRPLPRQHRSPHQKRRHPSLGAMYRTPPWTHPPSPKHQSTPSLRRCSRRPARRRRKPL